MVIALEAGEDTEQAFAPAKRKVHRGTRKIVRSFPLPFLIFNFGNLFTEIRCQRERK